MVQYPEFFFAVVFMLGACIGSFLNVVIFRIPVGQSIVTPGSHCPGCGKAIPFYLNIPILSYLFLGGKCKFCRIPISIRYPGIETLTGLIFLMIFSKFGITPETGFWFIFASVLIAISFIDLDHQIIPDTISIPGTFIFTSSVLFIPDMTLVKSVSGILMGGGILYIVALAYYLLKKVQGMGGGDIKLLAMIGAATGIEGVLFTLMTSSLIGTIAGLGAMVFGKSKGPQVKIPFGPFLSLGALIYVLWGESIILWYLGLLTLP